MDLFHFAPCAVSPTLNAMDRDDKLPPTPITPSTPVRVRSHKMNAVGSVHSNHSEHSMPSILSIPPLLPSTSDKENKSPSECPKTPVRCIKEHDLPSSDSERVHRVHRRHDTVYSADSAPRAHRGRVQLSLPRLSLPKTADFEHFKLPQAVFTEVAAEETPSPSPFRETRARSTSPFPFSAHCPLLDPFHPDQLSPFIQILKLVISIFVFVITSDSQEKSRRIALNCPGKRALSAKIETRCKVSHQQLG